MGQFLRKAFLIALAGALQGACFCVTSPQTCAAADVTWIYDGDGAWSTPQNWSSNPSLPGPDDDVLIDQPGLLEINVVNVSIHSLVSKERLVQVVGTLSVAAASETNEYNLSTGALGGAGNFTINGRLEWFGGSMTGAGKTILAEGSTATIANTGPSIAIVLSRTLENSGTLNYSPASSTFSLNLTDGTLNNLAAGTLNYSDTQSFSPMTILSGQGTNAFNNAGTFNFAPSLSLGTVKTRRVLVPFNNSGVTNVSSGILSIEAGGTNSGTINVTPLANVAFANAYSNTGTLHYDSSAFISTSRKTLDATFFKNEATGKLVVASGNLTVTNGTNAGEIQIAPNANLTLASMTQTPGSTISGAGSLSLGDFSNFSGSINTTGTVAFFGNVTFGTNQSLASPVFIYGSPVNAFGGIGGTGNVVISSTLDWLGGTMSGTGKTTLAATSTTNIGPNAGSITVSRTVENAGIVNYQMSTNSFLVSGTINNLSGGIFNVSSSSTSTLSVFGGTGAFNNAGTFNLRAFDSTRVLNSTLPLNNSGILNLQLGTFNESSLNNTGTINIYPGANLTGSRTNSGVVNFKGGTTSFDVGTFTNSATGRMQIESGSAVTLTNAGSNAGVIDVAAGASLAIVANYQQLAGSSITGRGDVSLSNISNFAGSLAATGEITIAGTILNANQTIAGVATTTGFGGTGNVTFKKTLEWTQGTMFGTGITTIDQGAMGAIELLGSTTLARQLQNSGSLEILPSPNLTTLSFTSGTLSNLADGTLNIVSSSTITTFSNSGTSQISNAGVINIELTPTGQNGTLSQNVPLNNTGVINVLAGAMTQNGGGTNSGDINVFPGAAFSAGSLNFTNSGDINYIAGTNSVGITSMFKNSATGHINVLGGVLTITGTGATNSGDLHIASGAQLTLSSNYLQASGATITGPGSLVITSALTNFLGAINSTGPIQISAAVAFEANQQLVGTATIASDISGAGDVALKGPSSWGGGSSTMSGTGKTIVPSGSVLQFDGGFTQLNGRTLNNAGILRFPDAGPVTLTGAGSAILNNQLGGVVELRGGPTINSSSSTPIFNNLGLVKKTGSNNSIINWTFNNDGVVQVLAGTLNVNGAGIDAGSYSVDSGATLWFAGNRQLNATANVQNAGTFRFANNTITFNAGATFSGPGSIQVAGGTATFGPAALLTATGPLTISSGALSVTSAQLNSIVSIALSGGALNIAGDNDTDKLAWTGGTLGGSGITTVGAGKTLSLSTSAQKTLKDRTLNNAGTIAWSGGNFSLQNATLNNQVGGVVDAQGSGQFGNPGNTINNLGIFRKSGGSGETAVFGVFNNAGVVDVQTGSVRIDSATGNGTFNVATNSSLYFEGNNDFSHATFNAANGSSIEFRSQVVQFGPGTQINGDGSYRLAGAKLSVTGDNTFENWTWLTGTLTGAGTTTVPAGRTLLIDSTLNTARKLDGRKILNRGTITLAGIWDLDGMNGGVIDNVVGATINLNDSLAGSASNVVNNYGLLLKTISGVKGYDWTINNVGTLEVQAGTFNIDVNSPVTQLSGTTLTGGTWNILNGSKLQFGFGRTITTLASDAAVRLNGSGSAFTAIDTLQNNGGKFQIDGGRQFIATSDFENHGTLVVGSGSAVVVPPGFTLTNTGIIQGVGAITAKVISSGTISPGMSPGMLILSSDLTLENGSQLALEIGGTQLGVNYDSLYIQGAAALAGGLQVKFTSGFQSLIQSTDAFEVLTALGGLSASFDIASGGRVYTSDGIGSFVVNYPAGADSNSVVLSNFIARGDFNRDGVLTGSDIPAMLSALTQLDSYESTNNLTPAELLAIGDLDQSGTITNADIQGLLGLLQSGSGTVAVPEPAAAPLAILAAGTICLTRRREALCV
jgi:fibronectin-binding autotransporter adhesin